MKKSKFNQLFRGYSDLTKELFFIKNENGFFKLPLTLFQLIFFLGIIGILRNIGEVLFGINPNGYGYWYSMHPSILYTMFFFPLYLSFFSSFVIFHTCKLFGIRLHYLKLFSLISYLQILHLIVPFIDKFAFIYNLPFDFPLNFLPNEIYFSNVVVMTLGIMAAWLISFFVIIKVFLFGFKIPPIKGLLALIIGFLLIYLPIYHIWPLFNHVFNLIFSIDDNPFGGAPWGYGTFFMLCSFIGLKFYLMMQQSQTKNH